MKIYLRAAGVAAALCASTSVWADVTGTAFLDYNGNGIADAAGSVGTPPVATPADVGLGGITVSAVGVTAAGPDAIVGTADDVIGACGPSVTTSTTPATIGQYSVVTTGCLASARVRIEFAGWSAPLSPGLGGATTVQFVAATATGVNLPLINAAKFCENNPQLATSCYVSDNQISGVNNAKDVVVSFPLSAGGTALPAGALPLPSHLAIASQVGSTYGLAFQQTTQRLFAAAYTKNLTGYGPSGSGAIYTINRDSGGVSTFVDINSAAMVDAARPGLFGAGAAGLDPFPSGTTGMPATMQTAWGDIDLNPDQSKLYALNLNNLRVYAFPASGGSVASSALVEVLPAIPFPSTDEGCVAARQTIPNYEGLIGPHAFGMGVQADALYVGGRCLRQNRPDGNFYVFRYDLALGQWDAAPVFSSALTTLNYAPALGGGIIGDIVFDQGDMILATRNAASDYLANPAPSIGQLLRACPNGTGQYVLESNGSCGAKVGAGVANTNGPGNGQFFAPDIAADSQRHSQQGGLVAIPERNLIISTSYDEFGLYQAGATWWDATSGARIKAYQVLQTPAASPSLPIDGKGGVLGELELMCKAAPVEIGNRLWKDLNKDGLQDPNEPPLAGVMVELRSSTNALLATAVSDANGNYLFSNDGRGYPATGSDASATGGFVEDSQGGTSSTTANRYGVKYQFGDIVTVVIPNAIGASQQASLAGLTITQATAGGNPALDSNFGLTGNNATAAVTVGAPGANNHTIDAGFVVPVIDLTISKAVTSSGPYAAGSNVRWDLVATNNGPAEAQERVIVKDCLPVGLNFVSATGTGWVCANVAGPTAVGSLTCSSVTTCTRDAATGNLAAAGSASVITVNATVAAGSNGNLVNYAQVNPAANETVAESNLLGTTNGGYETGAAATLSNNDTSASINVATLYSIGDLVWNDSNNNGKIDGSETPLAAAKVELFAADVGGNATGAALGTVTTDTTGRYRFDGLAAGDYVVVVTPPVGYVSSTGTAVTTGVIASDELDSGKDAKIAAGSGAGGFPSAKITLGAAAPAGERNNATAVPAAQISGLGGESPDNRSDRTADFGFYQPFDLKLTKAITSAAPFTPGVSTITYTLNAENLGPGTASAGIVVKDKLPAGLTATSASGTDWTCTPTAGAAVEITCTRSSTATALTAGATAALITVTATVDDSATGSVVNIAQVNPSPADAGKPELIPLGGNGGYEDGSPSTGSNNDDSRAFTVGAPPTIDLTLAKTITSTGPYSAGLSTVTYQLLASNLGPSTAQAAIVVKDKLPAGLTLVSVSGTNWACSPVTGAAVEITCTRVVSAGVLASGQAATVITVTASIDATATGALLNVASVSPSGTETLLESNPIGTTNGGYEDGSPSTGSNNDDSKSITVGAATYSLGNRVWNDINNNGRLDLGEVGLGNVTVRLLNAAGTTIATTVTDGMGFYQFIGLAAGAYIVEIAPPSGYVSATGANGGVSGPYETAGNANNSTFAATTGTTDHGVLHASGGIRSGVITLSAGQPVGEGVDQPSTLVDATPDDRSNRNVDFGLFVPASVGTVVWIDNGAGGGVANDGVKQAGEAGIAGVVVKLLDAAGNPVLGAAGAAITTTTAANGTYTIGNLNPGSYQVEFVFPAGSVTTPTINPAGSGTPPTNGGPGGTDGQRNEMSTTTRRSPVITLGPGQDNPNLDAGVRSFDLTAQPVAVPTLGQWMLLLMAMLTFGVAVRYLPAKNRR